MLRALLCPLCQNLILLLLRELEVLLAEEPEPRSLRAILAAWVAAAHVPLEAAGFPGNPVAAGLRQRSRDSLGEHLRKAINQGIEWVRGASGHMAPLLEERMVVQATYAHYGRGVCRDRRGYGHKTSLLVGSRGPIYRRILLGRPAHLQHD